MTGTDILIADDELAVRRGLARRLEAEGCVARLARDGKEALALFRQKRPDLLLLDIAMPRLDGFAVCTQVRQMDSSVPILFLTANATEANEVYAFGCGADDFLDKAGSPQLLLARLRRALARAVTIDERQTALKIGSVAVNLETLEVSDGASVEHLTHTEAGILRVLAASRGSWITKDDLIAALRGAGFSCEDGMIYTHVSRLRRKLGSAGNCLRNERCSGYCLGGV